MPETALRALPLLERALTLEPDYALAHGHAAFCYENLFVRAGRRDEHRQGAIRHAHAAIAYGRDDATALTLGGFNLGMIEHDRAAAREAFEAAIVLSPSSAFAYILGSIQLGFAGDVERAIEWGERGLRLSPLDPWSFVACHGMFLAYFQAGRFEQAMSAATDGLGLFGERLRPREFCAGLGGSGRHFAFAGGEGGLRRGAPRVLESRAEVADVPPRSSAARWAFSAQRRARISSSLRWCGQP